jgi:anti-sigma B factor antagonist
MIRVTTANLTVDERAGSAGVTLVLRGEIDIATAPALRTAVQRYAEAETDRVVLDFADVTFCDSQGLSALVTLANQFRGRLVLTNLGDFMVRLLAVTGLKAAFTVE